MRNKIYNMLKEIVSENNETENQIFFENFNPYEFIKTNKLYYISAKVVENAFNKLKEEYKNK